MRRPLCFVLLLLLLANGFNLGVPAQENKQEPVRKRGAATAEETRPNHFPHRIWAACDFEGQSPDYASFGPTRTKDIPKYPGNITVLGVKEKPFRNFSALMTGINPVPWYVQAQLLRLIKKSTILLHANRQCCD